MRFGEFLVSKNLLNEEDIRKALEIQRQTRVLLGKLAVDMGYISKIKNLQILMEQNKTKMSYGEIAIKKGFLTEDQIHELIQIQKTRAVLFGKILREHNFLTRKQLTKALLDFLKVKNE